ncbi:hypothetical protein [Serratia quinivorans]|uniref:hypothetical protein n=1 Tax=Serratia quinivorans TaxID=137545 RepID=UPI00217B457A|nr:hypothetical protein [Serratia quinivorans]CAI1113795.1 Uncharacterised protein [Serratia quinivorans]CAI2073899.1 Uncharacterised protein [Serratia quinivorans]
MNNIEGSIKLFKFKSTKTTPDKINSLFQCKLQKFQAIYLTNLQQQIATLVGKSVVYPEQVDMVLDSYFEANDRLLEIYKEFEAYQDVIAASFLSVAVMEYMKSAGELVESLSRK